MSCWKAHSKVLLVLGLVAYGVLAWYLYTRPEVGFGLTHPPVALTQPDTGGCGGGSAMEVSEQAVKSQLERNRQLLEREKSQ